MFADEVFRKYPKLPKPEAIFDIQNVADYTLNLDKDVLDLQDDCISLKPPFKTMWVEFKEPSTRKAEGKTFSNPTLPLQYGYLLQEYNDKLEYMTTIKSLLEEQNKISSFDVKHEQFQIINLPKIAMLSAIMKDKSLANLMDIHSVYGIIEETIFVKFRNQQIIPTVSKIYFIDKNGKFIKIEVENTSELGLTSGVAIPMSASTQFTSILKQNNLIEHFSKQPDLFNFETGIVILMMFNFLHCKNIRIQKENVIISRQTKRLLERKSQDYFEKYYTLNIEPMRKVLDTEGNAQKTGIKKALHICRGNFAHFTEEKPLFGKYAGTFWRPAHMKGNPDIGIIDKDYKILTPRN